MEGGRRALNQNLTEAVMCRKNHMILNASRCGGNGGTIKVTGQSLISQVSLYLSPRFLAPFKDTVYHYMKIRISGTPDLW